MCIHADLKLFLCACFHANLNDDDDDDDDDDNHLIIIAHDNDNDNERMIMTMIILMIYSYVCVCVFVCVCVCRRIVDRGAASSNLGCTNQLQSGFFLFIFSVLFYFFKNNKCDLGCVTKYNQVHFLSLIFFEYNRISSLSPLPFI